MKAKQIKVYIFIENRQTHEGLNGGKKSRKDISTNGSVFICRKNTVSQQRKKRKHLY